MKREIFLIQHILCLNYMSSEYVALFYRKNPMTKIGIGSRRDTDHCISDIGFQIV